MTVPESLPDDPTYAEWLREVRDRPDQDEAWRMHELIARSHYATDGDVDLGGEA